MDLQEEVNENLSKTLTKDDVVKLTELDDGIVEFISHIRHSMEWGDKELDAKEVEVIFGILNETHDETVVGLRKLITEFSKRAGSINNVEKPFLEIKKKQMRKTHTAAADDQAVLI